MTLLEKLTALTTALNEVLTLVPQVQTQLTALNTFLDSV